MTEDWKISAKASVDEYLNLIESTLNKMTVPYDSLFIEDHSAFITGSRWYGKPGPDSDFDLVVRLYDERSYQLMDRFKHHEYHIHRADALNLIFARSDEEFQYWFKAREICKAIGFPIDRDIARAVHNYVALREGVPFNRAYGEE